MSANRATLVVGALLGLIGLAISEDAHAQARIYGYNGAAGSYGLIPTTSARNAGHLNSGYLKSGPQARRPFKGSVQAHPISDYALTMKNQKPGVQLILNSFQDGITANAGRSAPAVSAGPAAGSRSRGEDVNFTNIERVWAGSFNRGKR